MKKDYTHITVILDRTGSMESIRDDTIGGFNAFLDSQKSGPGSVTLTLVQFDSMDPFEVVHRFRPVGDIPKLDRDTFVPRASTPLLDAIGLSINDLEKGIAEMEPDQQPENVIVAIVTDGQENASCEFRKSVIERMIRSKTDEEHWSFVFLSADLDAFNDAESLGFAANARLLYKKDRKGSDEAWGALIGGTSNYRVEKPKKFGFVSPDEEGEESFHD